MRRTSNSRDADLSPEEVAWVLDMEGNETTYLKFVPALGGDPPADGQNPHLRGTFYFRQGQVFTLGEMFRFAGHVCTCFDIYRTFVHLPIFVYKRYHSSSGSELGLKRKAAKLLRHEETGSSALPRYAPRR